MRERREEGVYGKRQVALAGLAASLLALWSIVATALFAYLDMKDTAILGWVLTGFVIAASLARPFRYAGVASTAIAIIAFFGAQFQRVADIILSGVAQEYVSFATITVLCFAVTGLLSAFATRQIMRIEEQVEQSSKLIAELALRDGLTGALKSTYGDRALSEEIERSRRYNRSLSLVLLEADDWSTVVKERGGDGGDEVLQAVGRTLSTTLRKVDKMVRHADSRFALILPETKAEGAQILAQRLCRALAEETGIRFRAGVAEFPRDAVSRDELLEEANAALEFARTADVSVAGRSALI